ncbi:MAG: S8 family serine peptidase [Cyanobacteria bacterium P01_F01_bin.150]
MVTRPNDPLFSQQWHLENSGDGNRQKGIDLNVLKVWPDYTGNGVTVGIIDDGVERDHEDLTGNYESSPEKLPQYSYERDGEPERGADAHGTAIAGIIAASKNDVGGTGIAYNAKLVGFLDTQVNTSKVLRQQQAVDISSNSWGLDLPFQSNFAIAPYKAEGKAIETAARNGRDGLGTVFVFAAGNEAEAGASSNYGGYEGSRFTIPVAALGADGLVATYSVQGSNLLVSAPSDDGRDRNSSGSIVTTDRTGQKGYNPDPDGFPEADNPNYTQTFGGTSAAAPMVSGVVALMLEANPQLGYRDVQEILAYSARQVDRQGKAPNREEKWAFNGATNWNGGGLHTNLNYGYGLVDAHAAVRLAETWTTQNTLANEQQVGAESTETVAIVDNATSTSTINVDSGLNLDHVEVGVNLAHQSIEDLVITLVSPNGTRSRLFNGPGLGDFAVSDDSDQLTPFTKFADNPSNFTSDDELLTLAKSYRKGIDYRFSSTFNWGETGIGDWTLEIQDTKAGTSGTLNNWSLSLYGDQLSDDNTYFYSNDFARTVRQEPTTNRTAVSDDRGTDTINAAMVTRDSVLHLKPGKTSQIAGQALSIEPGTIIENAFGGDGRDRIGGNRADNRLAGGRNDDVLIGRHGADTLLGEAGDDRLRGGKGDDQLLGGDGNDRLMGGGGDDRLEGGNGDDLLKGQAGTNQLVGNAGNDIFVLNGGDSLSIIQDFEDGSDRLKLGRGLSFGSLTFAQNGNALDISSGNNVLASLTGISASQIDVSDFTNA